MDEWKDVPGYEGVYIASRDGRVYAFRSKKERIYSKGVYLMVLLSLKGVKKMRTVHSIIALTFIGPRPNGYQINHKDGVKHNNHVDNLEYVTMSENILHSYKYLGRRSGKSNLGRFNGDAYRAVKVRQLDLNGNFIKQFGCIRMAAKEVMVAETSISNALNGRAKTSAGYKWEYA